MKKSLRHFCKILLLLFATSAWSRAADSVCAQVQLHLEQRAVIARTGFKAQLQLTNNKASALQQVKMTLAILDATNAPANDRFGITGPKLTELTAVDGTGLLAVDKTGMIEWTLTPTRDAATAGPTVYSVGGQLSYVVNGVTVNVPFYPAPITVLPAPSLKVKYFWEQSVSSDDAFTPQIEPAVPFALGLLVQNTGLGAAKNFTISSGQPTITKNEKGLLIGFQLIGSQVGSQKQLSPSFTARLGDIVGGQSAVAVWYLTSTLQGDFKNFQAGYRHVDDLGNPRTSLIDGVEAHDLTHVVRIETPQDDEIPDFLANDLPDAGRLPDTLYSSNGAIFPVSAVTAGTAAGNAGTVTVNATMPAGWSYLRMADPSGGLSSLISVQRSDGVLIRVPENAWTTKRTLHPVGEPAKSEIFFHLLDFDSTGSYTLTFGVPPGTIQFATDQYTVELTGRTVTLQVQRSGSLSGKATVFYSTVDDSATAGVDYTAKSGTLAFATGESKKTISIPIVNRAAAAAGLNKSFSVVLSQISGPEILGSPAGARVAIVNPQPRPFAPVAGTYLGLVLSGTNGVAGSGLLRVSVGKAGTFSAKLIVGGKTYSFSGTFDRNGFFSRVLKGKGLPSVLLTLNLDLTDGTGQVSGLATVNGVAFDIVTDKNFSSAKANPSSLAGSYNLLFPPSTDSGLPAGYGFGRVVMAKAGTGRFAGTMADGVKLSQAFSVTRDNAWPLYALARGGKEVLIGTVSFEAAPTTVTLNGDLDWSRSPQNPATFFGAGFTGVLEARGSSYVAPPKGARVMVLPDTKDNLSARLSGGGLLLPFRKTFTLGLGNRLDLLPAGPDQFKLKIAPAGGTFSGSFFDGQARKSRNFQGIFLQNEVFGAGYFLGEPGSGSIEIAPPAP